MAGTSPDTPRAPADLQTAQSIALRSLAHSPRTRSELSQTLARRGVTDQDTRTVLDRLARSGLVDDASLARDFIEARTASGGWGRRALAFKLERRGVAPDVVQEALAAVDPDDELERAIDLAVRRHGRVSRLDSATQWRRIAGFLSRRGFSPDVVSTATRTALAQHSQSS